MGKQVSQTLTTSGGNEMAVVVDEKYYLKNEKAKKLIHDLIEKGDLP